MCQRTLARMVVVGWAVAVLLTSVVTGCGQKEPAQDPNAAGPTTSRMRPSVPMEGPIFDGEWVSLEVAEQRMPFSILQPAHLPDGVKLSGVMVTRANTSTGQTVALLYSDGLRIVQAMESPPEPDSLEEMVKTPPFALVEVGGVPAVGHEPGEFTGIGGTRRYPGGVGWWKDGVGYSVAGDLSLDELVRIAESLR